METDNAHLNQISLNNYQNDCNGCARITIRQKTVPLNVLGRFAQRNSERARNFLAVTRNWNTTALGVKTLTSYTTFFSFR